MLADRPWLFFLHVPAAVLLAVGALSAQDVTFGPSGPPAFQFGSGVSLSGGTAVLGASSASDESGAYVGAAYVFVNDGGSWTEQTKLMASDAAAYDLFGRCVSIDGNTAIVGSPEDDNEAGAHAGSAYVFVRTGTVWSEQAKLTASDARALDRFGWSVAIFGDTVAVGVPEDDGPSGQNAGSVYVYSRSGTVWTQQAKLVGADSRDLDRFGSTVAISGETVAVGAPGNRNYGGNDQQGAAYVFVRTGTVWTQQAKLLANDATDGDLFGWSVSISGDTALAGALNMDSSGGARPGFAYVFQRSGAVWTQQAKLGAGDGTDGDGFGRSVSISGNTALVGADGDDNFNTGSGAGYVFARSGTVWSQQEKLASEDAGALGVSVVVQGDRALLGATGSGGGIGTAYLWSLPASPAPPVAAFSGSPLRGKAPLTVSFADASTGTITARLWSVTARGIRSTRSSAKQVHSVAVN